MSRGHNNVSFLPDIEEPRRSNTMRVNAAHPDAAYDEDDGDGIRPAIPPKRRVRIEEPLPSQPTVTMTPREGPSWQEPPPEPPRKRKRDDAKIVAILNMLLERVNENTQNIEKYVLQKKESEEDDLGLEVRPDKVQVEVRVIFMNIIDVDTIEQRFNAEIFVQSRWLEPRLQNKSQKELESYTGDGSDWTPKVIITNLVGEPEEDETWTLAARYPEFKYPAVTMRRKIKGHFSEILELNDFPLDVQELTVQVSTSRSEQEVVLVQDNYRMSTVNTDGFLDQDEFELFPHVIGSSGHISSELSVMRDRHSAIFFACSVKRKPGYFFWNIFLMMFLITTLMFTAFAIPATNPHNRLAVTLTLLLTAIAFKFIINKSIPQIPYLTYLDIYVITCMVLLALQAIQNAVITVVASTVQREIDLYSMYFLATCHVTFHVAFGIFLIVMSVRGDDLIKERNEKYLIQKELVDSRRKKMKYQFDADMYGAPVV